MRKKASNISSSMITSTKEKITYAMGDVGSNFVWTFVASFLTIYYTDSVKISAGIIGTMMLVARILDGVSDIVMGTLIEKTHSRFGKARPWMIYFIVPFTISLILLFNVPGGISSGGQIAYVYCTYIFMAVICYTAVNLSYHSMLPLISADTNDRNKISSVRSVFAGVATGIIGIFTTILLNAFGGEKTQKAWTIVAIIYAVMALVSLLICVIFTKEKDSIKVLQKEKEKEKLPLKTVLKATLKNKYFFLAMLLFMIAYLTTGVSAVNIYYARDVLGNANLFSIITVASVASIIGMVFAPKLFEKIGKRNTIIISTIIAMLSCGLALIAPSNAVLFIIMYAVRMLGFGPIVAALFTLAADNVDYGEWKTGIRAEGFSFSSNSFGMKVGTGLGSAMLGWILSAGKYDGSLEVQPKSAIDAMIIAGIVIPLICSALIIVLMLFWDLDKKLPQAQKELLERKGGLVDNESASAVNNENSAIDTDMDGLNVEVACDELICSNDNENTYINN